MSFGGDVNNWADKAERRMEEAIRKIALSVFREVILMSPVDTGRFRGNWQVAINSMPQGTVEIDDKSGSISISKADAAAMQLKVGQAIYLVNNLPYARALEYGHSKQAPSGMVRVTVRRWKPIVEQVAGSLSS
jgi:hypothetical protein